MSTPYVLGWRFAMGLVGGAVVGGLAGPALLSSLQPGDEASALAILLSALFGGVVEAISEWQHKRRMRRLQRLTPHLEEIPHGWDRWS